jgi:hypothetical protein
MRGPGRFLYAIALPLALLGPACGDPETPEGRVRAVLDAIERAAEEGDLAAFKEHVSEAYSDEMGHDRRELMAYLTFHVMGRSRRHVLLRVQRVDLRSDTHAEVSAAAGLMGSRARAQGLSADVYHVDLDLALEGDDWRIVWAQWWPTEPAELL